MNFDNNHRQADKNTHAIVVAQFQQTYSLNVWVVIIDNHLVEPLILPPRLNGDMYMYIHTYIVIF